MENKVTLRQLVGRKVGTSDRSDASMVHHDLDQVFVNGRLVGQVSHKAGAPVQFTTRRLSDPTRKEIRDKVAAIRSACGGPAVAEATTSIPDPNNIRGYLEKLKAANGETTDEGDDE